MNYRNKSDKSQAENSTEVEILAWKYRALYSKVNQYIPIVNRTDKIESRLPSLMGLVKRICTAFTESRQEAIAYCRYLAHDMIHNNKKFGVYCGEYEDFVKVHNFGEDLEKGYAMIDEIEDLPRNLKFTNKEELLDWGNRIMGFIRIKSDKDDLEIVQCGGYEKMSVKIFSRYTDGIYLWKEVKKSGSARGKKPAAERISMVPDKSFAELFLNQKEFYEMNKVHRLMRSYGHEPASSFEDMVTGDICYNSWRGFKAVRRGMTGSSALERQSFEILKRHIDEVICNGEVKVQKYVWSWLAHLVQHPEVKVGTCLCITGQEGSGKGGFAKILEEIIGSAYAKMASTAGLESQFTAGVIDPLVCVFDEFKYNHKIMEVLKSLITDDVQTWEDKNVKQRTVKTYTRYIILTNNEKVIPLHDGSRRFLIVRSSDRYCVAKLFRKGKKKEAQEAVKYHNDFFYSIPYGVGLLMDYLYDYDIKKWAPQMIPHTQEEEKQREYGKSPLRAFVEDLMYFEGSDHGLVGQKMGIRGESLFITRACEAMQCGRVMYIKSADLYNQYEKCCKMKGGSRIRLFNMLKSEMGEGYAIAMRSTGQDKQAYMIFNYDEHYKIMSAQEDDSPV